MLASALLRPARTGDLAALARLHAASLRATHPVLAHAQMTGDEEWYSAWARRLEEPGDLIVADAGHVVGFAWTTPTPDADDDPATVGQLRSLHVAAAARGTGVGRTLLAEARRRMRARGAVQATLWVVEGNTRAQWFYGRDGWATDGAARAEALVPSDRAGPLLTCIRMRRALTARVPPDDTGKAP
jgi:ribosomal protein S18 acetylase RimI-like enzyme